MMLRYGLIIFGFGIVWSTTLAVEEGDDTLMSMIAGAVLGTGAILISRALEKMLK